MAKFFEKVNYWFEKLSSRPKIGGLQISDSALQFVLIERGQPLTAALRLPPGVIKNGQLQNRQSFLELLRQLHGMIKPDKDSEKIRTIVNLPAELVFSQSFNVPNIDPELADESARLNMQMISPLPPERVYLSWQKIGETSEQIEFLGAVAEKKNIDEFTGVLAEANFQPTAFEFPALALARLISKVLTPGSKAVLTLHISSDGLDLFILKNNQLYFDHFRSWQSIQGEGRQITRSVFEAAVADEVQRVINFTISHFKEKLIQVLLIAPGFEEEIKKLLESTFKLQVSPLTARSFAALGPSWFATLGSALRGVIDRSKDTDISLSILTSVEEYYQEQTLHFVILWRNIIVGAAVIFLVVFIGVNIFLVNILNQTQAQLEGFKTQPIIQELTELQSKAGDFNRLVALVENVKNARPSWLPILDQLQRLASKHRISFDRLIITSIGQPIQISARAPSSAAAVAFKNALVQESNFTNVDLPLASVATLEDNSVSFSLSFSLVK